MFATALSALIDPRDRSVTIACAGHPPPLLLRGRQVTVLPVDATMPVLMMDLPKVPDVRHALRGGDRLLFYTYVVTERSNPGDDMYGWFWAACAVTTIGLVVVTKAALREREYSAVMAATGLLYLAILTAFGTDLVARAVLAS